MTSFEIGLSSGARNGAAGEEEIDKPFPPLFRGKKDPSATNATESKEELNF